MDENELKNILTSLQNANTKLYNEYGLIEEVLDLQTTINKLRNKFNIADETKMTKDNEGFVQ